MSDYRLELKVKNQRLLTVMEGAGCKTAADLSRLTGVSQAVIGKMLNLKLSAYGVDGTRRQDTDKLCLALGVLPEEIFPDEVLYVSAQENKFVSIVSSEQMERLSVGSLDPAAMLDAVSAGKAVAKSVDRLSGREREVLTMRFGLDGDGGEMTLSAVALNMGVSVERVRQIELRAFRRLRNDKKHPEIRKCYEDMDA